MPLHLLNWCRAEGVADLGVLYCDEVLIQVMRCDHVFPLNFNLIRTLLSFRGGHRLERLPARCEQLHGALRHPPAPFHARETLEWSRAAAAEVGVVGALSALSSQARSAARLRLAHGIYD